MKTTMDSCRICRQPLDIMSGQQCPCCRTVHCPFCGVPVHVFIAERHISCKHVVAMACLDECDEDAGGWEQSPFASWQIQVPRPSAGLDMGDIHQLVNAFGILLPLLNAYEEDGVDTVQLFDLLLENVAIPVQRVHWRVGIPSDLSDRESSGTDVFTFGPDELREQVSALVCRLRAGFDCLADTLERRNQ